MSDIKSFKFSVVIQFHMTQHSEEFLASEVSEIISNHYADIGMDVTVEEHTATVTAVL